MISLDRQIAAVERAINYVSDCRIIIGGNPPIADLTAALATLRAVPGLVEAAREAEEVFALVEHPNILDPDHWREVQNLGDRIGYGALMTSASASWRQKIAREGMAGGEFVAGPCRSTVVETLKLLRASLLPLAGAARDAE